MKRETYPQARERLFRELKSIGFEVKPNLKIPQVKIDSAKIGKERFTPNGAMITLYGVNRTLYFHSQAIYLDDLSTGLDIRGMSADTLLAIVTDIHQKRLEIGR